MYVEHPNRLDTFAGALLNRAVPTPIPTARNNFSLDVQGAVTSWQGDASQVSTHAEQRRLSWPKLCSPTAVWSTPSSGSSFSSTVMNVQCIWPMFPLPPCVHGYMVWEQIGVCKELPRPGQQGGSSVSQGQHGTCVG